MTDPSIARRKAWLLALAAALAVAVCASIGGVAGARLESERQRQTLEVDVALRRELLRSEIERHRLLPTILADNPDLSAAVDARDDGVERSRAAGALDVSFERLAREDGAATLYLIRRDGVTVASSNHGQPTSFVGQDYSFRPYFRDAMANGVGEYFAQGTISGIPGLYLARRLASGSGVVVVKVEFADLERRWRAANDETLVVDAGGTVLLTTNPALRFKPLDASTGPGGSLLLAHSTAPQAGWTLWVRRDAGRAILGARLAGVAIGALLGVLATLALWLARAARLRRERTRAELESLVAARTVALEASNSQLTREIEERARSEARVQKLRDDLAQANRLAALGQISAGVAHEINQPVAAIRSNVDNARVLLERGQPAHAQRNLQTIASLTERIGLITQELRQYSRRIPATNEWNRLSDALDGAMLLLESRLRSSRIRLVRELDAPDLTVFANRTRIEQIIVNLVQNAIEALEGTPQPLIRITGARGPGGVVLSVADNGPGVPGERRMDLFTPFSSTKPFGVGLGLAICRDIVSDLGGTLDYDAPAGGGARFVVRFPDSGTPR
jgi:two-component system C4-dicarboxylate transport sensor histidine kinase DctB